MALLQASLTCACLAADKPASFADVEARAKQGDAKAQLQLGDMYRRGIGVRSNFVQSSEWIRKAAEQGLPEAQAKLGECYEDGIGLSENKANAVAWYAKAANQGNGDAAYNLSGIYFNDKRYRTDKNIQKLALDWVEKAAEMGVLDAQVNVSDIYFCHCGVKIDYKKAVKWNTIAAQRGDITAAWRIGYLYDRGLGTAQNYKEAAKWYAKAAIDNDSARNRLAEMYALGQGVPKDLKRAQSLRNQSPHPHTLSDSKLDCQNSFHQTSRRTTSSATYLSEDSLSRSCLAYLSLVQIIFAPGMFVKAAAG